MAYIDQIHEKHETNTSWMTEVPINIHEYRIISCLDAKKPSDSVSFRENFKLKRTIIKR